MKNKIYQFLGFSIITLCIIITLLFLASIIYLISSKGFSSISWEFLTSIPRKSMTEGGVAPAIIGTFYLVIGSIIIALPLGVACAIYINEYSPTGYAVNIIRMSINNLAGVPSVVFGLFGLAVFVNFFGFGVSILSGSLTLAMLILPSIISASQESLMAVPYSIREASLALGATQWQTIKKIVLPTALPGIMTGVILSIGRAAGETAPILFTAATFYRRSYPNSPMDETMALPYHIYALMTEGTHPDKQVAIAYGCSLILLVIVLLISAFAIILRNKYRSTYVN
jgi:phosphate transport system permease protein